MLVDHFEKNSDLDFVGSIGDNEYSFNILDELHFDEDTINEALKDHSKKVALLGTMMDDAKRDLEIKESALKIYKSQLWTKFKTTQTDENDKKYTDTAVTSMVEVDDGVLTRVSEVVDFKHKLNRMYSIMKAFADRKDLIQTFASNLRKVQ